MLLDKEMRLAGDVEGAGARRGAASPDPTARLESHSL